MFTLQCSDDAVLALWGYLQDWVLHNEDSSHSVLDLQQLASAGGHTDTAPGVTVQRQTGTATAKITKNKSHKD